MNLRPSGYEPDELPGCSTPRHCLDDPAYKKASLLKKKTLPKPDRVGTKQTNKVLTTLLTDPEDQAATYSPVP